MSDQPTKTKGDCIGNDWSPQQIEAIELFSTGELNCTEIATKLGVNPCTVSAWRKNSQFIDAIIDKARENLKGTLPQLYKVGLAAALKGDLGFFKTVIEHIEKLEEHKALKSTRQITFTWDTDDSTDTL